MGLDMFLTHRKQTSKKGDTRMIAETEAAYWRKANHIHAWFVRNVQDGEDDCKPYYVDRTDLEKLLALCEEVISNPTKAEELLPTQEGFFFGGTDYDEYYFEDLKATVKMLKKALSLKNGEFTYQSSW